MLKSETSKKNYFLTSPPIVFGGNLKYARRRVDLLRTRAGRGFKQLLPFALRGVENEIFGK